MNPLFGEIAKIGSCLSQFLTHLLMNHLKSVSVVMKCQLYLFITVHELRPSDIDVIAAFGDSITVSFCLRELQFFLEEEKTRISQIKNLHCLKKVK